MRLLALPVLLVLLNGCIPAGYTIASYGVDGVSYAGTGKSLTDHMLSDLLGRDCATWRILKSRPICHDFTPEEIAERKRNRDSIRYDEDRAYIATSLDRIDLDKGTVIASASGAKARSAAPPPARVERKPVAARATAKPVALVAAGTGTNSLVGRGVKPVALRRAHSIRRAPAGGHYLVFGSFRHRADAARFAGRHAVMQPQILPVRVRGKRYFRVVVRPDGHEALAAARNKLRRNGVTDTYTMRICGHGGSAAHCMKPIAITNQEGRPAARRVTSGG